MLLEKLNDIQLIITLSLSLSRDISLSVVQLHNKRKMYFLRDPVNLLRFKGFYDDRKNSSQTAKSL